MKKSLLMLGLFSLLLFSRASAHLEIYIQNTCLAEFPISYAILRKNGSFLGKGNVPPATPTGYSETYTGVDLDPNIGDKISGHFYVYIYTPNGEYYVNNDYNGTVNGWLYAYTDYQAHPQYDEYTWDPADGMKYFYNPSDNQSESILVDDSHENMHLYIRTTINGINIC